MNDQFNGINNFLNGLKLTILGTHKDPLFYAHEIGKVLDIKNIRKSVADFDDDERISDARKAELRIVTYQVMPNGVRRRRDNIILLTEIGVYRLIMRSNKPIAHPFQKYIFNVCRDLRQQEIAQLMLKADQRVAEAELSGDRRCTALNDMYKEKLAAKKAKYMRALDEKDAATQQVTEPDKQSRRSTAIGPDLTILRRPVPEGADVYDYLPVRDRAPTHGEHKPVYATDGFLWKYTLADEFKSEFEYVDGYVDCGQHIFAGFESIRQQVLTIHPDAAKYCVYSPSRINIIEFVPPKPTDDEYDDDYSDFA